MQAIMCVGLLLNVETECMNQKLTCLKKAARSELFV